MNQYRCDKSCASFDNTDETNHIFGLIFCKKYQMLIEPISQVQSKYMGCASHSDFQNERKKVLDELKLNINRVALTGFTKYTYRKWILEMLRWDGE